MGPQELPSATDEIRARFTRLAASGEAPTTQLTPAPREFYSPFTGLANLRVRNLSTGPCLVKAWDWVRGTAQNPLTRKPEKLHFLTYFMETQHGSYQQRLAPGTPSQPQGQTQAAAWTPLPSSLHEIK